MAKVKEKMEKVPLEVLAIQCIASLRAPVTTQDNVDKMSAEYATANLLRTYADKRYEAAKRSITEAREQDIAKVRNRAAESMMKAEAIIEGADWNLRLAANRPATKVDSDELRTELVRQGISVDIIDAAINKVTKKLTPALIITAINNE